MKLFRISRVQNLSVDLEDAWNFFSSPFNLSEITPSWLNLAVNSEISTRMHPGMIISYRLTPFFNIPFTWVTEITHVNPPQYFVDEQRLGPYRFWHHQHLFRPLNGGVEMIDTVHYSLKYGPFGTLLHAFLIRERLQNIFDFRKNKLEKIFNSSSKPQTELLKNRK